MTGSPEHDRSPSDGSRADSSRADEPLPENPPADRTYPRPRSEPVRALERRMQAVDPDYRLPLIDFWDPELAGQLENVRREGQAWICGDLGNVTLRYRKSRLRGVRIDLEVLDRTTGRRLRQDGSDSDALFVRLDELTPAS